MAAQRPQLVKATVEATFKGDPGGRHIMTEIAKTKAAEVVSRSR
jgi:hypothetical protein